MSPRRIVLLLFALLCLAGIGIGLWLWNKPHKTVDSERGISITADSLVAIYNRDEAAANARFLNKVIAVSGVTTEVAANADGQQTVLLSGDGMTAVFCTMRKGGQVSAPKADAAVVIKGFCSGKTIDVTLTDCVQAK